MCIDTFSDDDISAGSPEMFWRKIERAMIDFDLYTNNKPKSHVDENGIRPPFVTIVKNYVPSSTIEPSSFERKQNCVFCGGN